MSVPSPIENVPNPAADLPARDPGLPRFGWLAVGLALAIGVATLVRPSPAPSPEAEAALDAAAQTPVPAAEVSAGAALFLSEGCGACHATTEEESAPGPGLGAVGVRAARRVTAADYTGSAGSAEEYLREAIVDHCADTVPRFVCVPLPDIGLRLGETDVDALVDFLMGLTAEGSR